MKKFTYLMSLLLAFVGATATAQTFSGKALSAAPDLTKSVTSVGQINPDSYYVLYCKGRSGKYVMLDPSGHFEQARHHHHYNISFLHSFFFS